MVKSTFSYMFESTFSLLKFMFEPKAWLLGLIALLVIMFAPAELMSLEWSMWKTYFFVPFITAVLAQAVTSKKEKDVYRAQSGIGDGESIFMSLLVWSYSIMAVIYGAAYYYLTAVPTQGAY